MLSTFMERNIVKVISTSPPVLQIPYIRQPPASCLFQSPKKISSRELKKNKKTPLNPKAKNPIGQTPTISPTMEIPTGLA